MIQDCMNEQIVHTWSQHLLRAKEHNIDSKRRWSSEGEKPESRGGNEQQDTQASEFVMIPKMNGTNSKHFRKTETGNYMAWDSRERFPIVMQLTKTQNEGGI